MATPAASARAGADRGVPRHVFVMALERGTGKSAVVLGLAEVLSRRAGRMAMFRPLVAAADPPDPDIELIRRRYELPQTYRSSFALTPEDLGDADGRDGYERLLARVVDGCARVGAEADVVLLEGSDVTTASPIVELDLTIDAARHLAAPVLLVVGGHGRSRGQVLSAAHQSVAVLTDRGCTVLGVVCNRVDADHVDAVRAGLPAAVGELPGAVLPEVPLLAAPTVTEIADRLGAQSIVAPAASRDVARVVVGAMGLPAFLDRVADGDLVITPGDRADLVAGILAAHVSAAYPAVAGVVLSGGMVAEPVRRLAPGFDRAGIPVLAVPSDTYETASAVREVRGAIGADSPRKIATAIALFEDHVDHERLRERLAVARATRTTPLMFEQQLLERARADRRHIVLPESEDERVLRAAEQLLLRGVADLTLLGHEDEVRARASALGVDVTAAQVVDPVTSPWREPFARVYADLRRHRGVAVPVALDLMADPNYFGTMIVQQCHADGLVSGAAHTTAHTLRPAFEIIRTAPGVSLVSSAFLMCLFDRVLVYADCAVVPNPTVEQLADIAISAAGTAALFGIEPRVAMLSYSTGESGVGSDVEHVRRATALVRERAPELPVEGPIQYDAAVDPAVARTKLPGSAVAGRATVLIFPDLNTGNNTYKAVQRSAGAVAIGPVLQGLARPVNDLSRGATVTDIVNTVAITAIQAQKTQAQKTGVQKIEA